MTALKQILDQIERVRVIAATGAADSKKSAEQADAIKSLSETLAQVRDDASKTHEALAAAEKDRDDARTIANTQRVNLDTMREQNEKLMSDLATANGAADSLQASLNTLTDAYEQVAKALADLDASLTTAA